MLYIVSEIKKRVSITEIKLLEYLTFSWPALSKRDKKWYEISILKVCSVFKMIGVNADFLTVYIYLTASVDLRILTY